ncbi:hypothetical protein EVU96_08670 [Bacillus infantis]|uniref:hypothetical protein n=1 Tax=Bacillus infantis TaxID=324767 RepID=UPI00101CD81C|nr:hypothetical protein [Bacillus infantis]RYI30476.1 hypothetical protein EVU96_08670 [Bacillus infantis]
MEKVISDNGASKLVADVNGGVLAITQYLEGEVIGEVLMYLDELTQINEFVALAAKAEDE